PRDAPRPGQRRTLRHCSPRALMQPTSPRPTLLSSTTLFRSSADPGSKDAGGSLGYIGRDAPFVSEFLEAAFALEVGAISEPVRRDRKSTRLNSSHVKTSYAAFRLKKQNPV